MTTAYTVLGVERAASHDEIATAYRKLAKQHHPDRGGDARTMARVNLAWSKLGAPEARAAYDLHLRDLERARPSTPEPASAVDWSETLKGAKAQSDEATRLIADLAQQHGLVDALGAQRVKEAGGKAGDVARGVVELINIFRG